jgi:hypothetical protein
MRWTPSSPARMPHRPPPASAVHASCRPPDPLAQSRHTVPDPLPSLLATRRARAPSPPFPPLSRCKEATEHRHLSSSVLRARFLSPPPAHHLCHLSLSLRPPLTVADRIRFLIMWRLERYTHAPMGDHDGNVTGGYLFTSIAHIP